jgi:hypothetical protein
MLKLLILIIFFEKNTFYLSFTLQVEDLYKIDVFALEKRPLNWELGRLSNLENSKA